MHRTGRVGRDVFDIDLFAGADAAAAASAPRPREPRAQRVGPRRGFQGQVDEAGTGHLDRRNQVVGAQLGRNGVGEITRLGLGFLGQHHGGIGRHVAMARVLRRLDHHAREVGARRQRALGGKHAADRVHARQHVGENVREEQWNWPCNSTIQVGRRWFQIRPDDAPPNANPGSSQKAC